MNRMHTSLVVISLFLASVPSALAGTTWYVNGATGTDVNDCLSNTTPCKTIGHSVSLALSGDSIWVDAGTYTENLVIGKNLNILGSSAVTTIIDGGGSGTVVTISSATAVILSGLTIRNGSAAKGGGIYNSGMLTLDSVVVSANHATTGGGSAIGGGIYNAGALTVNNSTISGNGAAAFGLLEYAYGGGIANSGGTLTISNTTINGNSASLGLHGNVNGRAYGGAIANLGGILAINNSTLSGNHVVGALYTAYAYGGAISNGGTLTISNTTISGNNSYLGRGGGIFGSATIQNSIVASNSAGNCSGAMTSKGYNLSSDGTCNWNGPGDGNNIDPQLGPLQNNGGPTQTMALPSGSRAIDAGNPGGCTDNQGNLLKTDQRGMPRPDKDFSRCDIGAYESQTD